jgi:hypothetical protein
MNDWDPMNDRWDPMAERRPTLEYVQVSGIAYRLGDRVRLWPLGDADIMDIVFKGKTAVIEAIERDFEDRVHIAVTVDDDPGRDFGIDGKPGHRFFFKPEEVEPMDDCVPNAEED